MCVMYNYVYEKMDGGWHLEVSLHPGWIKVIKPRKPMIDMKHMWFPKFWPMLTYNWAAKFHVVWCLMLEEDGRGG